jgi:hypothetical protein
VVAVRTDMRREVRIRRVLCALIVAGSAWWLWSSSSPWDRPVWPVSGIASAWLVLLVGLGEDALSRRARGVSIAGLAAVTIGFLFLAVYRPLGVARYRGVGPLERTATRLLDGSAVPSSSCSPGVEDARYGEWGVPDEVCVRLYDNPMGTTRRVEFRWDNRWMVYEGGDARPIFNNRCFAHLDGAWWALTEIGDDMNCPYGFTFSGSN